MTPIKAIRAKCLDCCCGQLAEVRLCPCDNCPLWPYRMGKRPKIPPEAAAEEKREIAPSFSAQTEKGEEDARWTAL